MIISPINHSQFCNQRQCSGQCRVYHWALAGLHGSVNKDPNQDNYLDHTHTDPYAPRQPDNSRPWRCLGWPEASILRVQKQIIKKNLNILSIYLCMPPLILFVI